MTEHDADRFDAVVEAPGRVGAHRAHTVRRRWVPWVSVLASSAVLVVGALAVTSVIDARLNFDIPVIGVTPSPTETAAAAVAPTDLTAEELELVTITVLNANGTVGVDATAATALETAGWPLASNADAAEKSGLSGVIYGDAADEGIARAIADELGIGPITKSSQYPGARITVILGSDFSQK